MQPRESLHSEDKSFTNENNETKGGKRTTENSQTFVGPHSIEGMPDNTFSTQERPPRLNVDVDIDPLANIVKIEGEPPQLSPGESYKNLKLNTPELAQELPSLEGSTHNIIFVQGNQEGNGTRQQSEDDLSHPKYQI